MAQIRSIVSEAIEAQIRRLLPSQDGFTEDMQAQNVIVPVIDITPAAEGTQLPEFLQTAISFNDATAINVTNTTTSVVNTPGFWRVTAGANIVTQNGTASECSIFISDGLSSRLLWSNKCLSSGDHSQSALNVDLTFLLAQGDTLQVKATAHAHFVGSCRQVADIYGNLITPTDLQIQ